MAAIRKRRSARRSLLAAAVALGLGFCPAPAWTQETDSPAIGSRQDAELVATLIRSMLIALHHANVTGNYTVLRDLGAPGFRERNTAADLAAIFAPIRAQGIDLETVAVLQPEIEHAPQISADQMMTVTGSFATSPVPISFELVFQLVDRTWRMIGISVGPLSAGLATEENAN